MAEELTPLTGIVGIVPGEAEGRPPCCNTDTPFTGTTVATLVFGGKAGAFATTGVVELPTIGATPELPTEGPVNCDKTESRLLTFGGGG